MRVLGGRVRLDEKLASGGMGDVWRGTHLVTGADVAVKLLAPATHPDEDAVERFRTEAHISAVLAHPNIVRVFDLLEEKDGTLALVMELLVGSTLDERLAKLGPVEPEVAVAIAVPLLSALEHAHAVSVVHRDVKPANVFLAAAPDGRVTPKLLDFGVAKSSASGTKTIDGRVLGTARYVSPEQARGEPLDGRSNLFSLAVVVYQAMTGESPFAAADLAAELTSVLERVVDPDERIPPRLWLVLKKALAKRPYERHPDARAMSAALVAAVGKTEDDLARLLRGERPPLPRLDTPLVAVRPPGPRRAWRPWPLAVGAVAASAVAAFALLRRPNAHTLAPAPPVAIAPPSAPPALPPSAPPATPSAAHARSPVAAHATATTGPHLAPRAVPSARPRPIATTPGF